MLIGCSVPVTRSSAQKKVSPGTCIVSRATPVLRTHADLERSASLLADKQSHVGSGMQSSIDKLKT